MAPGGSGRRINGKYEVNLWRSIPVEKRSGLRRLLTGNVNWIEMICFRLVNMFCFVLFLNRRDLEIFKGSLKI